MRVIPNIKFLLTLVFNGLLISSYAQTPIIQWQKSLGGTDLDEAYSINISNANGFIITGYSDSWDGDLTNSHGGDDLWLVKLDTSANLSWQKSLGGTESESGHLVLQTLDGGYIICGNTSSIDGDVTGLHVDFFHEDDYWIVKTDNAGNIEWQKCLGGTESDRGNAIYQTADSGYVVIGEASSNDGDVAFHYGCNGCPEDFWIVKIDKNGNLEWQKTYGGTGYDFAQSIIQTANGGYIAVGVTTSIDGDVTGNHGGFDAWVIRLDSAGNLLWQKCYGGSAGDALYSVAEVSNGEFVIAGNTDSDDGDVSNNHGVEDAWLLKINNLGTILWQKCFGGSSGDNSFSMEMTTDGGFVMTGETDSNDGDVTGNHGQGDFWIIKTDQNGNLEWQKCLGGSSPDIAYSVKQCSDNGFIIAGFSESNDGDVTGNHSGGSCGPTCRDFWVVKLSPSGTNVQDVASFEKLSTAIDDKLHYSLSSSANCNSQLQLFDVMGRIIFEKQVEIKNGYNKSELQIPSLSPAVYFVRVKTEAGSVTAKVVKQ